MPPVAITTASVASSAGPAGPTARTPQTALSSTTRRRASKPSRISIDGVARAAATSARISSRPAPSPPACTMRAPAVRGFEPEREAAVARAVEAHAEPREPLDRGGRGAR